MKYAKIILIIFTIIISLILLIGSVKGSLGVNGLHFQTEKDGSLGGPFESSGSTSRYALTEAVVEDGTVLFNEARAKFSAPDLVYYQGKFFTIFTPGVSFLAVPFYWLGKQFGLQQLFSYSINLILFVLNSFLIYKLARKLGASLYPAIISALVYLFATNALAYALTFTQHSLATFVVLLAILSATWKRNLVNNILFGLLFGLGILADIPVGFLLLPVGLYVFFRNFEFEKKLSIYKLSLKISFVGLLLGLLPLLFVFGWYNKQLTGSYTQLGQMIGRTDYPPVGHAQNQKLSDNEPKGNSREFLVWETPFRTRHQLGGFYILLLSNERGWLYYSPVLFLGFLGLILALRNNKQEGLPKILLSVALMNLLLYSMFADAYGGWAFGPRYMIPAAAIVATGIGYFLQKTAKKIYLVIPFAILVVYSSWVCVIGSLTTNAIPPKVEAEHLITPIPYTYDYNLEFISKNLSSSLIYNAFFKNYLPLAVYSNIFLGLSLFMIFVLYIVFLYESNKKKI